MAHLPSYRWTRGWTDKEQSSCIWPFEIFFLLAYRRRLTEVNSRTRLTKNRGAIKVLADADSGLGVVKGADDATERFEGCKGVQGGDGVDVLADGGKRSRVKNVDVLKLSDEESVRWWRWLG
jgi:hypothetical protein